MCGFNFFGWYICLCFIFDRFNFYCYILGSLIFYLEMWKLITHIRFLPAPFQYLCLQVLDIFTYIYVGMCVYIYIYVIFSCLNMNNLFYYFLKIWCIVPTVFMYLSTEDPWRFSLSLQFSSVQCSTPQVLVLLTLLDIHYYIFNSERLLTTPDFSLPELQPGNSLQAWSGTMAGLINLFPFS